MNKKNSLLILSAAVLILIAIIFYQTDLTNKGAFSFNNELRDLQSQSKSTEISDIEEDIIDTDLTDIDKELDDIEKELNQ